jgi:hypothetical protein
VVKLGSDTIELPVVVPQGGSSVFVRIYTPKGSRSPTLEIQVDKGRPRVRTGLVEHPTVAKRRTQPSRSTRRVQLLDQEAGGLQAHQGTLVVFGDDLRPGAHSLQIRLKHSTGPVYVRFDSATGLPAKDRLLRNWYAQEVSP